MLKLFLLAQDCSKNVDAAIRCGGKPSTESLPARFINLFVDGTQTMIAVGIAVGFALVIWGGIRLALASNAGSIDQSTKARAAIITALAGVVVMVVSAPLILGIKSFAQ